MKILAGILFTYLTGYSMDNSPDRWSSAFFFALAVYFFVSDYLERN